MKKLRLSFLVVVFVSGVNMPSWPQPQGQLDDLKREAIGMVDEMHVLTQQMVDQIFSFSELGFEEHETSKYVTDILERRGFNVERSVAGIPTDIDCIPKASQTPGVAYHDPIIEGAPGHGEGHNSGQAVNVTAALALKTLMEKYKQVGTFKLFPGVAEELLATKALYVRAGLFKDVDIVLGAHVSDRFATSYGQPLVSTGLVSVQYFFHGRAAHSAHAPWAGRSALDAVELMNAGWNFRRRDLMTDMSIIWAVSKTVYVPSI